MKEVMLGVRPINLVFLPPSPAAAKYFLKKGFNRPFLFGALEPVVPMIVPVGEYVCVPDLLDVRLVKLGVNELLSLRSELVSLLNQ